MGENVKHTPGPWIASGTQVSVRVGFSQCIVCDMNVSAPSGGKTYNRDVHLGEYRANTRLIAAAPDLLAALQLIAEGRPENPIGDPWAFYDDLVEVARSALAKAETRP